MTILSSCSVLLALMYSSLLFFYRFLVPLYNHSYWNTFFKLLLLYFLILMFWNNPYLYPLKITALNFLLIASCFPQFFLFPCEPFNFPMYSLGCPRSYTGGQVILYRQFFEKHFELPLWHQSRFWKKSYLIWKPYYNASRISHEQGCGGII